MAAKQISRVLKSQLNEYLLPNKVLIVYGARRVGKTELVKDFLTGYRSEEYLYLNGEDADTVKLLNAQSKANYQRLLGDKRFLIIDEAQHVPLIGQKLKLMVDEIPGVKILATGSSVFDLGNQLGEPLVGRKYSLQLFPIAQMELQKEEDMLQTKGNLEERLVFGSYPELWQLHTLKQKQKYLQELVDSYLLKDILAYEGIRKADKIHDLLRLLAFQVGKEVSVHELANNLSGISRNTVEQYLDLLTKVFVIYPLGGFSNNLRKEVSKSKRWYFYDNGIRNALIRNFNLLALRNDVGELWENYLASERIKYQSYQELDKQNFFWRTYDQQELDWVEQNPNSLNAYEFKWNEKNKVSVPKAWMKAYPNAGFQVINPSNYLDWIT
ncbi:ATP-binding protein [Cytophagales bacterium LB-30]|uniref:ATP-binding protein n=1 Tax=Shiella aurantiaca TaxID=3058365 RepID=A0ABT8F2W2_9BACT|nr:ATP-binding protein [Shiella aurantiaca]MDN4164762.1 ATP-binding protein [Shiella aurantiaca]